MGFLARQSFAKGWCPDCDAVNAPSDALLRMDNCVLDERGVVALRPGYDTLSSLGSDVHSLFTSYIGGTRYRMAGAGSSVYANGSAIATGLAGSDDVAFGFQLGQILFARSTSKSKYDGSTVRNWGIGMAGAKATVTPIAADKKTLSTGASGELSVPYTGWFQLEGPVPNTVAEYDTNHYPTTDPLYNTVGAVKIKMAATKRAVYQFYYPSVRDYTVYDGGRAGVDDDLVSMYINVSEPKLLKSLSLQVDVNDGRFLKDWYESPLADASPLQAAEGLLPGDPVQFARVRAGLTTFTIPVKTTTFKEVNVRGLRFNLPVGGPSSGATSVDASGWMKVEWRRGDFVRQGRTNGKGWNSVIALRLVINATAPDLIVKMDTLIVYGGAVLGTAKWRYAYVNNNGKYTALSALSPVSDATLLDSQDAQVLIPADASRDSQVNEIWVYRQDQQMDTWYRVQVKTGVSGTGAYLVTDRLATQAALDQNLKATIDLTVPPDNIIGIVGPHYDRTLALTSDGKLYPSQKLDPDAFATSQVIQVCGQDETPLWIYKAATEVYIGTTKDIYRLEGTGAENPDASIDYLLRGLNMDHKPLNEAVAHEGHQIVFCSDDGWRAFSGEGGSVLLTGETSLLYHGQARHGVSAVNLKTGRFRVALGLGKLVAITPEGSTTTSSSVLYRYAFADQRWYRHTYTPLFRSIYREKDGTVLLGTSTGLVLTLDTAFTTGDAAAAIPVVLWTKVDDLGLPYQRKKIGELQWRSDTGGVASSLAVHLNNSGTAAATLTATQTGMSTNAFDLGNPASSTVVAIAKHLQVRLTGSFLTFKLYEYGWQFRERPAPIIGRVVDSLGGSPGVKILSGFVLRCCTLGAARVITPYLDGVADAETFTITTSTEEPETHTLRFSLSGRRATDMGLAIDGEIEIDSWSPIVTQRQPLGVLVWDSGPIMDGRKERVWLRELLFKVRAGADLVVTPYFDGTAFPSVTIAVEADVDTVYRVPVGRSYVGKQPRIVVTSCAPFYPYHVQAVRRESGAPSEKPKIYAPMTLDTPGGG